MSSILLSLAASKWLSKSRRARSPPWIFGWRVFTRPSIISGKPVTSSIAMVSTPALSRATLVPPVEIISQPSFLSSWANSTMPALSETLIKTRLVMFFPLPSYIKYLTSFNKLSKSRFFDSLPQIGSLIILSHRIINKNKIIIAVIDKIIITTVGNDSCFPS
ncbi:Uncharacterised protein [Streptococcus pneumoniae]|nr:Uncharacterised protein [Streptococcus pneumoniae]